MHIAVIGTGQVGGALAKGWAKAGHQVFLAARDLNSEKVKTLLKFHKNISADSISVAVQRAEVVLIATPAQEVLKLAKQMENVKEKVLIDATNSLFSKPQPYQNASEALRKLTNGLHVVKCFNSTGFENMKDPVYSGSGIDMFMAGNSVKGKEIARKLALDLGFAECYDFGGDDKITLLEQLAMAWINLAMMQKQGRNIAFKIIRR